MTAQFTPARIKHFKDLAKRAVRSREIPHHAALDEVAAANGFKSWQLLVRASTPALPAADSQVAPFTLLRDAEGWRAALRTVKGANARQPSGFPGLHDICAMFSAPVLAVKFAQNYMAQLLDRPRFWVRPDSQVQAEMRWWLPYSVHEVDDGLDLRLLLNRHYKPVGTISPEFVEYTDFPGLCGNYGLNALRSFSSYGDGSGYLYDDGTTPWRSRADAETYLTRLNALEAVCLRPVVGDTHWRREHQNVYEVLRPWAGIATWFTAHGHDERRLGEVLGKFRRWGSPPTEDELRVALTRHRDENPDLLGGKATERHVERYVQRISEMLTKSAA